MFLRTLACLWVAPALAFAQQPNAEPTEPLPEPSETTEEQAPPPPVAPDLPAPPTDVPEPPAPPAAEAPFEPPPGDINIEDWNRDDWMLLKPAVNLIEIDGYFRVRGDMFRKLDFDNRSPYERFGAASLPRYPEPAGSANFVGTNMRLRVEPTINVTDKIQVITTIDVLDNIVLGSTPNTIPTGGGSPVNILASSQNAPREMVNALTDSVVIKRAYARMTALNEQLELRFGRMPNHWGLGMMTNDGDCLDCDYGDVTDRIGITFRAANHLFTPMYDWVASGPVAAPFGRSGGQPLDALDRDDVNQYGLQIERVDHPKDIRQKLGQGAPVINYGGWATFRTQSSGIESTWYDDNTTGNSYDPAGALTPDDVEARDAFAMTFDAYGKMYLGEFELGLEAAFIWGSFKDRLVDPVASPLKTQIYKLGAAFEGAWRIPGQRGSRITLKAGGASGDSMPGFGALDAEDDQRGQRAGRSDLALENFQFSPDYHVDLLMFRRIIGTVTDAWYVRPGVTYLFDENFAGSLAAIYSQALFKRTTPGSSLPMGLEFDAELSYGLESTTDPSPFAAALMGGIAFPFGAFDNLNLPTDRQGGSFAWTIQARLYVTF